MINEVQVRDSICFSSRFQFVYLQKMLELRLIWNAIVQPFQNSV